MTEGVSEIVALNDGVRVPCVGDTETLVDGVGDNVGVGVVVSVTLIEAVGVKVVVLVGVACC